MVMNNENSSPEIVISSESQTDLDECCHNNSFQCYDACFPISRKLDFTNIINYNEIQTFCKSEKKIIDEVSESREHIKFENLKSSTKNIIVTETRDVTSSLESSDNEGPEKEETPPNCDRFTFFNTELPDSEPIRAENFQSLIREGQSFQELFKHDNETGTWWLDCLNPTESEMQMFSKAFGIHPLTREDIENQETREKFELFESYYFVVFHTINNDITSDKYLEPIKFYMIVFKNGILTFHTSPVNHQLNVRRRIRNFNVTSDWICYALLDDITDGFEPIIQTIEYEADGLQDNITIARDSDFRNMIIRIGSSRKKVMKITRFISGKIDVIKMFINRCNDHDHLGANYNKHEELVLYLGDIQDHITTMFQNLKSYEKIFSRSNKNFLSQLKVETFGATTLVTVMFSQVTLVGTILVPLHIITGLFGMNILVPGDDQKNFNWFIGISCLLIFLCIVFYLGGVYWMNRVLRGSKKDEYPIVKERVTPRRKKRLSFFKRPRHSVSNL